MDTPYNEFFAYQRNFGHPRSADGAQVFPGPNNAMGSWVDLFGTTLNEDSYGIHIRVLWGGQDGHSRPTLMDIGADTSGGRNYSVVIPFLAVGGSVDGGGTNWRGSVYYFPVFMKAGTRLAARAQTSDSSSSGMDVRVRLAQKPSRPDLVRCGSFVDALGVNTANSRGTPFVPGQDSLGNWTTLGHVPRDAWFMQPGVIIDDPAISNDQWSADFGVGDATTKRVVCAQLPCGKFGNPEGTVWDPYPESGLFCSVDSGIEFFVRGYQPTALENIYTAIVHLVGGS